MTHHQVAVKPERRVYNQFTLCSSNHRRQPSRLSRVHEKEDSIVVLDEPLKTGYRLLG